MIPHSALLLLATFPLCVWLAARIYHAGILRYGQKTTWKELFRFFKSK